MVALERGAAARGLDALGAEDVRRLKHHGVSDARIARTTATTEARGARPAPRSSACGRSSRRSTRAPARSPPRPPTCYSAYDRIDEPLPDGDRPRVLILGSGPNRIGQGIEFDYCCVRAVQAFSRAGLRDGDGQLQPRDGLDRLRHVRPAVLRAAHGRGRHRRRRAREAGRAWWCSSAARRRCKLAPPAGRRGRPDPGDERRAPSTWPRTASGSARLLRELGLVAPEWGMANDADEAAARRRAGSATRCWCGRSYVLGGRAMRICYDEAELRDGAGGAELAGRPLRRGRDRDRRRRGLGRRRRGRRRGDAARRGGRHPLRRLGLRDPAAVDRAESSRPSCAARRRCWRGGSGVEGLVNVQFALQDGQVYVHRGEPPGQPDGAVRGQGARACRWSRPGLPGRRRRRASRELGAAACRRRRPSRSRRPCCRSSASRAPTRCSGPEMRSTGEVMAHRAGLRHRVRQGGARGGPAPCRGPRGERQPGVAFLSVCDRDKSAATLLAQRLHDLGFDALRHAGHGPGHRPARDPGRARWRRSPTRPDGRDGRRPDRRRSGVDLIVNTPVGRGARGGRLQIRRAAIAGRHPRASRRWPAPRPRCRRSARAWNVEPKSLQELHAWSTCVRAVEAPSGPYRLVALQRYVRRRPAGQFHMLRAVDGDGRSWARPLSAMRRRARAGRVPVRRARAGPRRAVCRDGALSRRAGPVRPGLRPRGGRRAAAPVRRRDRHRGDAVAGRQAFRARAAGGGVPQRRAGAEAASSSTRERRVVLDPVLVTEPLAELARRGDQRPGCGPGPDAAGAVAALAAEHGVPCQAALEAPMACGFGACYGCAVELDGACSGCASRARWSTRAGCRARGGGGRMTAVGRVELEHPVLNASGTLDALAACRGRRRRSTGLAALVTKTVTPLPRPGNARAADLREPRRDAELDRARQPRHRRVPRARAAGAADARSGRWWCRSAASRAPTTSGWSRALGRRAAGRGDRAQHLVSERRDGLLVDRLRPRETRAVVSAAATRRRCPLWVKLAPTWQTSGAIARAAEEAGADALVLDQHGARAWRSTAPAALAAGRRGRRAVRSGDQAGCPLVHPRVPRGLRAADRRHGGHRRRREDAWEFLAAGASVVAVGTASFASPVSPAARETSFARSVPKGGAAIPDLGTGPEKPAFAQPVDLRSRLSLQDRNHPQTAHFSLAARGARCVESDAYDHRPETPHPDARP